QALLRRVADEEDAGHDQRHGAKPDAPAHGQQGFEVDSLRWWRRCRWARGRWRWTLRLRLFRLVVLHRLRECRGWLRLDWRDGRRERGERLLDRDGGRRRRREGLRRLM